MATKKTDALPYDGEKLRHQIESHNYTLCGLSDDLGYSRTYLGNMVNHNKGVTEIPRRVVRLLETVGIHYDDYKPDPKPFMIDPVESDDPLPWEMQDKTITVKLDEEQLDYILEKLQGIVSAAIYSEVKKAWNE